jgi:hypothetical protein
MAWAKTGGAIRAKCEQREEDVVTTHQVFQQAERLG